MSSTGSGPRVRRESRADHVAVEALLTRAFGGVDEARIVAKVRQADDRVISLVAETGGRLAGHILFTPVVIDGHAGPGGAIALGPMAVEPDLQKRGIGSSLVEAGLAACREAGERLVFVLGHAEYYPRFGFRPAAPAGFHYRSRDLDPHFMLLELVPGAAAGGGGWIRYLPAFEEA